MGYLALAPLLVAVRGHPARTAAALGLASGTLTTFVGFFWLLDTLRTYSGFPTIVCGLLLLALCVLQGGRTALFAALVASLTKNRWPFILSVALAFATSELLYPLLFPWFLGATVQQWPVLIQTADVGGPILVGLPLAIVSAALASCAEGRSLRRPTKGERTTAICAIVLPIAYGAAMIPILDRRCASAPKTRIGIVQGNIPMPPVTADVLHDRVTWQVKESERLVRHGTHLVVWPESAFVMQLPEVNPTDAIRRTSVGQLDSPMLIGALLEQSGDPPKSFNSALMLDRKADVVGRYDKQHLLPFGEYLPGGEQFPVLHRLCPASGRISQGIRSGPVPFEDKRITVLICYEDILPGFVVDAVRHHRPHLLVNLTNDGWFGQSREPGIHLALAKFRAVEHRRYLVRATNTGKTAVVDPIGRVYAEAPAFVATSLTADVGWMHGWTLFGMWGNVPWYAAAILVGFGVLLRPPERWRNFFLA